MIKLTVPAIPPPEVDESANREAAAFGQGNLEEEARRNEHNRRERLRFHIGWAAVWLFWMAVIGVGGMALVWFYHLIAPMAWHWLSVEQVSKIQGMLFSGVVASVIPVYAKKYI